MCRDSLYDGSRTQTIGSMGRTVTIEAISKAVTIDAINRTATPAMPTRWIGTRVTDFLAWQNIKINWEDLDFNWESLG